MDNGTILSLAGAACAALMLVPQSGDAQSNAETLADIRACGLLERNSARLACFDGVLAAEAVEPGNSEPAERGTSTASMAADSRVSPVSVTAAPAGRGDVRTSTSSPDARSAEPVLSAPASDVTVTSRSDTSLPDLDRPQTVTIVDVNAARPGAARFVTDTGQVLVQTSGGTPRGGYPSVPFEATLDEGAFGSLFLGVSERRRVRVMLSD